MENIQVVSKMVYQSNVKVAGDDNDDVLVNRKYVTEDLLGILSWDESEDHYQVGTTVQHKGLIYTCQESDTRTEPGKEGSKWSRVSPAFGRRSGRQTVPSDGSNVVIPHNLGSVNISVQVYSIEDNKRTPVNVPFIIQDENNIVLQFDVPPETNHHVLVMAFD